MDDQKEQMTHNEHSPIGGSFLTPEERDVIRGIRGRGAAITVFNPEELNGTSPRRCEDAMCERGHQFIEWEREDDICPECHARMKTVMVPDNVGKGLHEELVCPDCEGEDDA